MRQTSIIFALLAAASATTQAQSNVTVYGVLDAGVEYVNNANAAGDSLIRQSSGGTNTSRIGFRGTEDLGAGLKALFQLEGGILLDTGASDGALFGRQANVGLEGNFGRVIAGRSYSTTYDFLLPFDPMGYAPLYSWATSSNATGGRRDGMLTGVSNLIKYQGTFNGVKLGATYAFGEAAGSSSDSARLALGVGYATGPVSFAAVIDRANGARIAGGAYDKTDTIHLGVAYDVSKSVDLKGGYRNFKRSLASGGADLRSDLLWGGVNFNVSPALTLTTALYHQNIKNVAAGADADPTMLVLQAKYTLSKRTFVYGTTGYVRGRNNQLVSLSRDDAGFGTNQTGVTVGIQHRF
ncbi:porin [Noviherbaspirillum sp. CPCC 100848]|uniref:Porin n=1 Tax=Noviherbaspirillum album TaxID=3080276 RepID=A0ABU6J4T2_9BURK|nr:porin [Noviherbaspirillum sp. CPCC 100848]MEC4718446.1 porin [Noviherbaspirillum sp. CPCC 100848]